MTVSFKVGDITVTSGEPSGGSIELAEIKDHLGNSGTNGQLLGKDLVGLIWSDLPQASSSLAGIVQLTDSTSSTSVLLAATANSVKSAYDLAAAAIPQSGGSIDGSLTITGIGNILELADSSDGIFFNVDTSFGSFNWSSFGQETVNISSYNGINTFAGLPIQLNISDGGTGNKYLAFRDDGSGNPELQSVHTTDGVTFLPDTLRLSIKELELNGDVGAAGQVLTSGGAGTAPTWQTSSGGGGTDPLASASVMFVNPTIGNNATAARGTDRPFATIAAALAAASEGDTIFLSAGTFTENFTISKGVHLAGTYSDQATWSGTKILGNVVVNLVGAGVIRNLAISDIYFISANSTSPVSITGMSPGAGGINTFTGCTFTQQTVTDTAQFAFQTSGTWTRSVYLRNCTIDGNFKHNAGTAAGASGYIVIDQLLGVGNSNMYHSILTGTVEYRNPSNSLASILHTGGIVLVNNASSGITPNSATTTSVFGGTGFSYKGSAAAAGAGTIYFQGGSNQGTGKVDIGANLIYGWTNLTIDSANLTVSGSAIAYTTAVPSSASAQSVTQQRPRLDLLRTPSVVTAANRLDVVVDSTSGVTHSVTPIWLPLVTQTLTTTTPTTILTLPIASFRGVTVSISASNVTGGNFHNDTWMIIHNGTTTNTQLAAPGARIGSSPYSLTSTISGANLLVQVTSASANSTKYVGYYQAFAV